MKGISPSFLFWILTPLIITAIVVGCATSGPPGTAVPPLPSPAATVPATQPPAAPPVSKPSASFQVASLTVTPADLVAGKTATATAEIKNSGGVEGTYTAKLNVDSKVVGTKDITVAPGATQKVTFSWLADAGTHTVELGGLSKTVKALKPATLEAKALKVVPEMVFTGQTATVEAEVANTGEAGGTVPLVLKVNGVETDSRLVTLQPGASTKASFTITRDLSGKYDLNAGGKSATINVTEAVNYQNMPFSYSISYPKGWTLNSQKPAQLMMSKTGVAVVVAVDRVSAVTTADEYFKMIESGLTSVVKDYKLLSQSEVRQGDAVIGKKHELSFATSNGIKIKSRDLIIKKDGYVFYVNGQAQESIWELNKSIIDAVIESFKPPVTAAGSYTNITQGYSITLPSGWTALETGQMKPLFYAVSPLGQPQVYVDVYLARLAEGYAAKDYALDTAGDFSRTATRTGFKVLSQGEATLGGGFKGYEVVSTDTRNSVSYKMKITSVVRGTQVFNIVVDAQASAYDSQKSTIDQLVRSFTPIEPRPFGVSRQDSMFYLGGEIVTLDPAITEEGVSDVVGAIFSGLVKHDKDLKIAPDIAEKWDISSDGKTYTFHLREGVKFHNGRPVTAQDFKYSWERALDPKTESKKASTYLGDIVGATEMLQGKATELSGVEVIDDRTLEVTIDGPKPYFLGKMAYVTAYVVDRANVARGKNWATEPNGTGPFKLKQWKKDELLILERYDNYHLGVAKLKNVVFQLFSGRAMMMYEKGEIDTTGVYLYDLERVMDTANPLNKELLTGKSMGIGYVGFNVTKPPFDDPKVRRAFALSLNLDKILEVSLKGSAERSGSFVPPGIPGHNSELKPLPFDPAQAKKLITESKYGSVDKLPQVTLYVIGSAGDDDEAMVAMWKQNLGVDVKVEAVKEPKEYYQRKHNREFQLITGGWYADYVDPQNFLEVLFQSKSDENYFAYSNSEVDAALKAAAVERDVAARLKKYQDIEKMILNDLPAVPFYQSWTMRLLVKPYVKGLNLFPMSINHWNELSIAPH